MRWLVSCLAAVTFAQACQCYPEPEWVFLPPPAVSDVRAKVAGVFFDAATQLPVSTRLTARARDANGQVVSGLVGIDGRTASTFEVKDGVLSFGLVGGARLPLDVTLVVEDEEGGYLSSFAQVRIESEGLNTFTHRLVSKANPPEGVQWVTQAAGVVGADGRLPEDVVLTTGDQSAEVAPVTVTLPSGARAVTVDGVPLQGALTATLAAFSSTAHGALLAFPGGFEGHAPPAAGAPRAPGVFRTFAFGTLELRDEEGRRAAQLDRPLVLAQSLETAPASELEEGDELPLFTRGIGTGAWRNEGAAEVTVDEGGGTVLSGRLPRIAWWSLGRFHTELCDAPARPIVLSGNPNGLAMSVEVGSAWGYRTRRSLQGDSFELKASTALSPLNLLAWLGENQLVEAEIPYACDTDVTLPVRGLAEVRATDLTVNLRRACEQDGAQFVGVPGIAVLTGPGAQALFGHADKSGQAVVRGLREEAGYSLVVHGFDGRRHGPFELVASGGGMTRTFEGEVPCIPLSGSAGQTGG